MDTKMPSCTCIIPCFNEQERVISVLEKITSLYLIESIVVVDDGSTDQTAQVVREYIADHPGHQIQLVRYADNVGKAQAISRGLYLVETTYTLLFDADLKYVQSHEIAYMIESMYHYPQIDMGILRRISSDRYIKLFYRELILSGQRMLKTEDLRDIFATSSINRYQLEVAINGYMEQHHKCTVWYPFSADNTFKHLKRGFRYGRKRDMLMFRDIFAYQGFWSFARQIFTFKPKHIVQYEQHQLTD